MNEEYERLKASVVDTMTAILTSVVGTVQTSEIRESQIEKINDAVAALKANEVPRSSSGFFLVPIPAAMIDALFNSKEERIFYFERYRRGWERQWTRQIAKNRRR